MFKKLDTLYYVTPVLKVTLYWGVHAKPFTFYHSIQIKVVKNVNCPTSVSGHIFSCSSL